MLFRSLISLVALGAVAAISGCSVIDDDDVTSSRFGAPPFGLNNAQSTAVGNGFGSVTLNSGTNDDGALAVATVSPLTSGAFITSATVTYAGNYAVIGIENISFTQTSASGGFISGTNFSDNGSLTLSADLGARTLTGSDGKLFVNGTFDGTDLNGTVTYDGQSGPLDGRIYEEGGFGGFHSNTADRVFSGGLTFSD